MQSSFDSLAGAGKSGPPQVKELHPVSPWLVVESRGVDAEEIAEAACRQCHAHGIEFERRGIDAPLTKLWYYHGLVITLSRIVTSPGQVAPLERIGSLVRQYRNFNEDGIPELLAGQQTASKAGIVQLAGTPKMLQHPNIRSILDKVCKLHPLDEKSTSQEVDFFSIFDPAFRMPGMPTQEPSILEQSRQAVWRLLEQWGIATIETAAVALQVIEDARIYYHGEQFSAMRRPFGDDSDFNRLDFILEDPNATWPKNERKTWTENGARAARYVLDALSQADPGISRPAHRVGKKGLQLDLYELYANLKNVPELSEPLPITGGEQQDHIHVHE
ncbi:hypothetical protein ACQP0C_41830 (plasmid) [Nocardia sp. CA-129566]|uniref:hypothetical protein n=1 Tax=Nocardia sp. CA-129566 TaxID=3239976 RepID=UPI003D962657